MKPLALGVALGVLALAGCGGGSKATTTTTTTAAAPDPAAAMRKLIAADPALAGKVQTLYQGSEWAVVQSTAAGKAHAVVFHLGGGRWVPDRSGKVKVSILGPQPGSTAPAKPQVAIEVTAKQPFVETALWVDGQEVIEKGGGSPTRGTIYGAPARPLQPGTHVAVGYGRTGTTGSAVAWTFNVG